MSAILSDVSSNTVKAAPEGRSATPEPNSGWVNWRTAAWLLVLAAAFHGSATAAGCRAVMAIYGGPVSAVVVDAGGTVYATAVSGIFKSPDGGQTWVSATGDLPVLSVQSIAADPVNAGTLYVGTNLAMFKTVNGGSHWSTLAVPKPRWLYVRTPNRRLHPVSKPEASTRVGD